MAGVAAAVAQNAEDQVATSPPEWTSTDFRNRISFSSLRPRPMLHSAYRTACNH